ncbi:APD1 Actin patches distal protein 1 [Candida maltosa Xu316]|uniref:Actin patches distal protein 1 n=1 Tax=Candida maltosa (strain Xu316) TaxID=1245528 RepID=M3HG52_CANMX|nr:hypothetical protein G210_3521 [Candida maltosa Xu316]
MTILQKFFGKKTTTDEETASQEIESLGFEISECSETCESCTAKFPKSLKFEETEPLWKSTKPYGMHILIATGKTDWPHDALDKAGTLRHQIGKWAGNKKSSLGTIKVNVSSASSDDLFTNDDYIDEKKGDILILPYFLKVKGVTIDEVDTVLDELHELLIKDATIEEITESLPKVSPDSNQSYVFFCSHATRDKRCGVTAPIMKREMDKYLQELDLYKEFGDNSPGGVTTEFINHIGGHKYAANVMIYLKSSGKNIWLGLCKPNNVKPIVDECIVGDGKVWPDKVRLVQKFNPIEW